MESGANSAWRAAADSVRSRLGGLAALLRRASEEAEAFAAKRVPAETASPNQGDDVRTPEFYVVQAALERRDRRRFIARAGILFVGIVGFAAFILWSSGLALKRSAASIAGPAKPTFRVFGAVVNAKTGKPVPWVSVFDYQYSFRTPAEKQGDFTGNYDFLTIPERHDMIFACEGYYPRTIPVGQPAHLWVAEGQIGRAHV